jgi:hypothetical protein
MTEKPLDHADVPEQFDGYAGHYIANENDDSAQRGLLALRHSIENRPSRELLSVVFLLAVAPGNQGETRSAGPAFVCL